MLFVRLIVSIGALIVQMYCADFWGDGHDQVCVKRYVILLDSAVWNLDQDSWYGQRDYIEALQSGDAWLVPLFLISISCMLCVLC